MKMKAGKEHGVPIGMRYPFTALVGQEQLRLALILHCIDPGLGGILIRGDKGTAKSTAVRAIVPLLPKIRRVEGCSCGCDPADTQWLCEECRKRAVKEKLSVITGYTPLVELPVSATEDRVLGSLDFEETIRNGRVVFQHGLLAEGNRGIIYVDEVNLLDDHLVDVLLDAAASGMNVVEREGISYGHPARYILIGTMNPEEGDIRPQLLDRFALCVEVTGEKNPVQRVAIMKRREEYEKDPGAFVASWAKEEGVLRQRLMDSREMLNRVTVSGKVEEYGVGICQKAWVAGHRADIVLLRAAKVLAAWRGKPAVEEGEVDDVAPLVLYHRRRDMPEEEELKKNAEEPELPQEESEAEEDEKQPDSPQNQQETTREKKEPTESPGEQDASEDQGKDRGAEQVFSVGKPFAVKRITAPKDRMFRRGSGRRSRTATRAGSGRYVRSGAAEGWTNIALDATIRSAAPFQVARRAMMPQNAFFQIEEGDIRRKIREKRIGNFLLFVVDASGSMGAQQRMVEAKGAVLSLLIDAYQKRDQVGMIAFRGDRAEVILSPTNSVEMAEKSLAELPVGGRTPLAAGLEKAIVLMETQRRRNIQQEPILILISDCKANYGIIPEGNPWDEAMMLARSIRDEWGIKALVIDTEKKSFLSFGKARKLAEAIGGEYHTIESLEGEKIADLVRKAGQDSMRR